MCSFLTKLLERKHYQTTKSLVFTSSHNISNDTLHVAVKDNRHKMHHNSSLECFVSIFDNRQPSEKQPYEIPCLLLQWDAFQPSTLARESRIY